MQVYATPELNRNKRESYWVTRGGRSMFPVHTLAELFDLPADATIVLSLHDKPAVTERYMILPQALLYAKNVEYTGILTIPYALWPVVTIVADQPADHWYSYWLSSSQFKRPADADALAMLLPAAFSQILCDLYIKKNGKGNPLTVRTLARIDQLFYLGCQIIE